MPHHLDLLYVRHAGGSAIHATRVTVFTGCLTFGLSVQCRPAKLCSVRFLVAAAAARLQLLNRHSPTCMATWCVAVARVPRRAAAVVILRGAARVSMVGEVCLSTCREAWAQLGSSAEARKQQYSGTGWFASRGSRQYRAHVRSISPHAHGLGRAKRHVGRARVQHAEPASRWSSARRQAGRPQCAASSGLLDLGSKEAPPSSPEVRSHAKDSTGEQGGSHQQELAHLGDARKALRDGASPSSGQSSCAGSRQGKAGAQRAPWPDAKSCSKGGPGSSA